MMPKKLKVSAWIGLLVATLILLIEGNPLANKRSPGLRSEHRKQNTEHESFDPRNHPPSKTPRKTKGSSPAVTSRLEPSPNFPEPAEHSLEDMKNFSIPELKLEDANLSQALTELLQQYHDICARTNHAPLPFTISVEKDPGRTFSLDLSNVSFTTALRIIAMRAGVALDKDGTRLSFASLDSVIETPENIYTTTLSVPPSFWSELREKFSSAEDDDASVLSVLKGMGIIRSQNDEVVAHYIPANSTLTLRGSLAAKERLEVFYEEVFALPPAFQPIDRLDNLYVQVDWVLC